jgi:hypothetical protein
MREGPPPMEDMFPMSPLEMLWNDNVKNQEKGATWPQFKAMMKQLEPDNGDLKE